MKYINYYNSPLGKIFMRGDYFGLTDIWFDGQKYYRDNLDFYGVKKNMLIFEEGKRWFDIYFSGKVPNFIPKINLIGSVFFLSVWEILCEIPYGEIITYGDIARKIKGYRKNIGMLSRAVGNAVSRNRISIIIPCHRVVGSSGNLTGYAGGIHRKIKLLTLENIVLN